MLYLINHIGHKLYKIIKSYDQQKKEKSKKRTQFFYI